MMGPIGMDSDRCRFCRLWFRHFSKFDLTHEYVIVSLLACRLSAGDIREFLWSLPSILIWKSGTSRHPETEAWSIGKSFNRFSGCKENPICSKLQRTIRKWCFCRTPIIPDKPFELVFSFPCSAFLFGKSSWIVRKRTNWAAVRGVKSAVRV
jgi:hypothetical protein